MDQQVSVLDHGYVKLVDVMGSDERILAAARKSYDLEVTDLDTRGESRVRDLAVRHHNVFRHCVLTFEVKAPLMVAREWWRYCVGSDHTIQGWNEVSRRFVKKTPQGYVPSDWGTDSDSLLTHMLVGDYERQQQQYEKALRLGAKPERARLFLLAYGLYTRWFWTGSLESVGYVLRQRWVDEQTNPGSVQPEMVLYADAVRSLVEPLFPVSLPALLGSEAR